MSLAKKRFFLFLILHSSFLIPHSSFLIPHSSFLQAQDKPVPVTKTLPFQQQAQPKVSDHQLAMQFFQARDYEKAVVLYQKLFEDNPSSFYYMYYLQCLIELNEYRQAERLIKGERKREPGALRYLVDLGYLCFRQGEEEKARKYYEAAIDELPPSQQKIFELANAFLLKGENQYAVLAYQRGRELLKGEYPFCFELANVYQRSGNWGEMFGEYLNLLNLSDAYLGTVQDRLQSILADDPDNTKNDLFREALLTRVQRNPDQPAYANLLWWYSIQQKDFEMALIQSKALDRRRQEQGDRIVQLAQLAAANEQYQVALDAYTYLLSKGEAYPYYDLSLVQWANTKFAQVTSAGNPRMNELTDLEKKFHEVLEQEGENAMTITLIQNLAHMEAFYLGKSDEAEEILYRALELKDIGPKEKALIKLELGAILLFYGDVWEATLLYQQVYEDFKYEVLGQTAKFKNTMLSFYIGEFGWAKAQADILKAATDKLIANDALALSILIGENYDPDSATIGLFIYSRADLLSFKNRDREAIRLLDSIPLLFPYHPLLDDGLMKKAEIYRKLGEYEVADSLLHKITTDYPDEVTADRALFLEAGLREKEMQDPAAAMELYALLLERYPSSIYVIEARKRYRILRGDKVD